MEPETPTNLPPTAPAAQTVTFAENSGATGTLMTVAGATDPESQAVTYALSGAADANPGSRFVVAADGKITLAAGKSLDFEGADLLTDGTGKYYAIKVVAKIRRTRAHLRRSSRSTSRTSTRLRRLRRSRP